MVHGATLLELVAAPKLKIKPRTSHGWLRTGKIKRVKIGDLWRIDEKDLQEFIDKARRVHEQRDINICCVPEWHVSHGL